MMMMMIHLCGHENDLGLRCLPGETVRWWPMGPLVIGNNDDVNNDDYDGAILPLMMMMMNDLNYGLPDP